MDEYLNEYLIVACSTCTQPIYLARHRLESRAWYCPACGATNASNETRQPVFKNAVTAQSRFARPSQSPSPAH